MLTFWETFLTTLKILRRPVSLWSTPLPLQSHSHPPPPKTPLHISLVCWRETEAPLQATAIICSFRGPAPEVLHSVRTCNVDSISAAIRPHPFQRTCLFVIPPPLSPSSVPHLHTWPPPSLQPPCVFVLPSLHSSSHSLLAPPPICPSIPACHLSTPALIWPPRFLPPLPPILPPSLHRLSSTPLHSTPLPSLAPRGALQTAYSTIGRHKDM